MKGYRDSFEKIAQIQGRVEYMKGEFSYEQMLQLNASCGRFLIKQLNENQIVNIIKLFHNNDIKKERNFTFVLDRHRNFSMNVFLRILGMEIRMTPTREQKGIEVKLLDRSMQGEAANLYVNKNSIIFIYPFDPDYNRTQEKYLYILH
ncbi:unnamed protein product [Caenorhabditis angaria]|uniref:Uncharacterized protein n=1 Tax=Caenorhabditis angaria TaxID=860376 RepID=A0A9P1J480_9PELO|nr:unnamed protein product [Caenorhabditis angaria]